MIDKGWTGAIQAIKDSTPESSIYIGCDSIVRRKKMKSEVVNGKKQRGVVKFFACYSVVVVVHRNSNNGAQIFHNHITIEDYGQLRTRLMMEVQLALEAAEAIIDYIGERHFEIHLDINPNPMHNSSVVVNEAIGWVRGQYGFDPKVKPESWASTHCADHAARHWQ